jgi:hypothetical protein
MLSLVTFTKVSFRTDPVIGEMFPFPKLIVPVKKANTVPSIFLGITFANSTMHGKSIKAKSRASSKNAWIA